MTLDATIRRSIASAESWSEAVKVMKLQYCVKAIQTLKMDYGILFCRTKLDCDNLERYMNSVARSTSTSSGPGKHLSCVCLHGDRKPAERQANLEKFKVNIIRMQIEPRSVGQ